MTPLALYGAALRRAVHRDAVPLHLLGPDGVVRRVDAAWYGTPRPGDAGLVARCTGPTIDIGCGPGRLTAALTATGYPALGVDISAEAVRQARRAGAAALHRCVFGRLPGEGRWRYALLADGNIGIGGDPDRLLRRCRDLVDPAGAVLVEVDPPGTPTWSGEVVLTDATGVSSPFRWAFVAADALWRLAGDAGLRVADSWTEADRWFANLARA